MKQQAVREEESVLLRTPGARPEHLYDFDEPRQQFYTPHQEHPLRRFCLIEQHIHTRRSYETPLQGIDNSSRLTRPDRPAKQFRLLKCAAV